MKRMVFFLCGALLFAGEVMGGVAGREPFLQRLQPGVTLVNSVEVPRSQVKAFEGKLGGRIHRLTNSILTVQGRKIQVNTITAMDVPSAESIYARLSKTKPYPFFLRKDRVVVEYVGKGLDVALATKASYELGLEEKPERVRYRVVAELATAERADYMYCNPLFNQFLSLKRGNTASTAEQIREMTKRFVFGRSLVLRGVGLDDGSVRYRFEQATVGEAVSGATVAYSFERLPEMIGVPYVTAVMEIVVDDSGLRGVDGPPSESLVAATEFWPADDRKIQKLARKITWGKSGDEAKAEAILAWLQPGKHLRYSGQTGSRWGTKKVLEQGFGHCWDFSDCFVTLCRAVGVPSRGVAGWLYGGSGHVWAEYYSKGKGWQQVDPTGGGLMDCGIYHIPYFTTEDGEMPILYLSMPRVEVLETE